MEINDSACPCCKSFQIEGDTVDFYHNELSQVLWCLECTAEWRATYQCVNIEVLNDGSEN